MSSTPFQKPEADKPRGGTLPKPPHDRQCTKVKEDGTRCESWSIRGGRVCIFHGGSTNAAKAQARLVMLGTVEPAVRALEYAMEQAAVDRDWGNVIKAAAHLLDRAGFGPTSKIVVEDDQRDLTELSTDELGARMEKLLLAIRAQQNEAKVDAGPFPATTH